MTKLTQQEQNFYNDLINDEIENKDLSILNVFFFGGIVDMKLSKKAISEDFQDQYINFFENSIFLFAAERSSVIGKYKNTFGTLMKMVISHLLIQVYQTFYIL